jgi:hypothetical protein
MPTKVKPVILRAMTAAVLEGKIERFLQEREIRSIDDVDIQFTAFKNQDIQGGTEYAALILFEIEVAG